MIRVVALYPRSASQRFDFDYYREAVGAYLAAHGAQVIGDIPEVLA